MVDMILYMAEVGMTEVRIMRQTWQTLKLCGRHGSGRHGKGRHDRGRNYDIDMAQVEIMRQT